VRTFADAGGTVVLITHKLREAFAVADDITVLRQGRTVLSAARPTLTETHVIEALTGTGVTKAATTATTNMHVNPQRTEHHELPRAEHHTPILALDGVTYVDARGVPRLRDVHLAVSPGEILGVIGVEGSGPRELLRVLAGRLQPTGGRVTRPAQVGFVPEDRLRDAVIPSFSLTENLLLAESGAARGWVDWGRWRTITRDLLGSADVRAAGPTVAMATLSGGNQQRFVVGRERRRATAALVVENPTRGLDLNASARILADLRSLGGHPRSAVVFHSADLDEVLSVATRVVACFAGRVVEVPRPVDPTDRTPYTRAMTGATDVVAT
jgi:simple sugar transport system ATP-binding protein